jgi:glycosyltransferase involved in cell wall biosynthesis
MGDVMNKLVVASNMLNEMDQIDSWIKNMSKIADGGILVVDGGSTDGTAEYLKEWEHYKDLVVITSNIIQEEGYGPARNHLREQTHIHFPNAHWMVFFDADERIREEDFHQLRFIKEYLLPELDVVAFPRIDWVDDEGTKAAKDWFTYPDYQARMTRIDSPIRYYRKLHEQIEGYKNVFVHKTNPKIHHFHRTTGKEKRDFVGRLCAKLHMEDEEFGQTYPIHHKEQEYREQYLEKGL